MNVKYLVPLIIIKARKINARIVIKIVMNVTDNLKIIVQNVLVISYLKARLVKAIVLAIQTFIQLAKINAKAVIISVLIVLMTEYIIALNANKIWYFINKDYVYLIVH